MITRLVEAIVRSALYVKSHPQILFALMLILVIPLLFLYTGQQFLEVGKANQDRLQKDKVGLMHDTFTSLLRATNFDAEIAASELSKIAALNPDILEYRIAKMTNGEVVPFVASDTELLGIPEVDPELFINASVRQDESIIFETYADDERIWQTYRAVQDESGQMYFLYALFSQKNIDALFQSREQSAYFSLIFIYCFVIALAYWHIRLTDYRYLYIKAQKANEMKDLFTNMIAHELRAPLTAITGYSSMLEEKLEVPEEKQHAQRIRESSERLIAIVNDLLDVARIQSGKLKVAVEEIDISSVVNAVIDELQVSAQAKTITLDTSGTDAVHLVSADRKRLHQALINLVSNAIKYTPEGVIQIRVEEKHAFVEIRVQDTGMGISSDDQKKLFAPFFRVANKDVSKITGTGLGMWITKELIELMGASIAVESIKGVGTHVVIALPKTIRIS